jgi:DNA-binding transcriptional ArsR family regulator
MPDMPDLAAVAALLGDPARSRMIAALMDGGARTATELALDGGVTPSTASSHLTRLTDAGLLSLAKQGRHRYFRIANPETAAAIEGLMSIAPPRTGAAARPGPRNTALRHARVCYDHLAGEAAVALLDGMRQRDLVTRRDESIALTVRGEAWCGKVGIDLAALARRRRPLCRTCLDWSERRCHLAGAVGAALLDRMLALRYARRDGVGRGVQLSERGERFVERLELVRELP